MPPRKSASVQTGALFWLIGTLFAVLEPALILFTVGLTVVGLVALAAWLLYAFFTLRDARAYEYLFGSSRCQSVNELLVSLGIWTTQKWLSILT